MDKKLEKKIEKRVGKKVGFEIKKDIQTEVKKEVEEKIEKEVEKEVEEKVEKEIAKVEKEVEKKIKKEAKKLAQKLYRKTLYSGSKFKIEFKRQIMTAITAAFAFLIALSWRTPIQNSINQFIEKLGLYGKEIYIEYLSAIVITIIAVLVLMWFSKGSFKE